MEKNGFDIYYWRTPDQQEVDFILYGENGLIAIEVKHTSRPTSQDIRGLKSFKKDYSAARLYLVHGGTKRGFDGDVELWPIGDFLRELPHVLSPS